MKNEIELRAIAELFLKAAGILYEKGEIKLADLYMNAWYVLDWILGGRDWGLEDMIKYAKQLIENHKDIKIEGVENEGRGDRDR